MGPRPLAWCPAAREVAVDASGEAFHARSRRLALAAHRRADRRRPPTPKACAGRILNVMKGHPYAGKLYPVSRSHSEVMGLKAYPSVADLPQRADLAVIIIPAQHVAGGAGALRQGRRALGHHPELRLRRSRGRAGAGMQARCAPSPERYDMAVMGPNSRRLRQYRRHPVPDLQPGHGSPARVPCCRRARARGQLAVIAQSGGIGFAFFDHGRAKELSFRYVVTTGNEACLETLDFADYILDEGKTDALLMLLEDVKSPETFRRVAEKALSAGKPIIVNKIGQSDAGARAAASHTAALAGAHAAYQAMFAALRPDRGPRHRRDGRHRGRASSPGGTRLPAGKRVGICTALGRRRRLDGGRLHGGRPRGARARRRDARAASTCTCRATARRRTRSMPRRRPSPSSATPG